MSLTPAARVRRSRVRRGVAAVVIVAWLAALGGLIQRDVRRTASQRMAELALRVNPGNFFYAVERDGRHIGYASSSIDTLPDTSATYVVMRDEIVFDMPAADSLHRAVLLTTSTLTRGFALLTFAGARDTRVQRTSFSGRTEDDSIIAWVPDAYEAPADTQRTAVEPLALLPSLVPLVTVLDGSPRVGRRATYRALRERTWQAHDVTAEIQAESLFVVDDSARMDPASGRWVSALRDTVRAWRVVTSDTPEFDGWLDAQGRIVEYVHPLGFTLRRMAFELAFENWRLAAATGGQ